MSFSKDKNRVKAREILRDNGFMNVLDRVCSVMASIARNGINEYSSLQELKTYNWGIDVLQTKYRQIKNKVTPSLQNDLYLEFHDLRDVFELIDAQVCDKIAEFEQNEKNKQETQYVFAIDVDNVLRDNLGEMVKLYNEHFNENKDVSDITNYKTEIMFPKIEEETGQTSSNWFFQEHSNELFVEAKPFDNVADDIKKLKEFGKIVIVTYQKTDLNKKQTIEWLAKNNIEYDSIVFTKDKSIVDCDYFIDDNDWNFQNCTAEYGALITAPYNKDVDLNELSKTTKLHCKIERFDSFHDFVVNFIQNEGR